MPTSSIVLIVERGEHVHHGLSKALLLARHLRAPLELFCCGVHPDAPWARDLRRGEPALADAEAHEYLKALRLGVAAADVAIRSEYTRAPSLGEGLMRKLQHTRARLVIRAVANKDGSKAAAQSLDRSLLRGCSSPLLLARKRAWRPVPRFAAALDLEEDSNKGQCRRIARLAEDLTSACGGLLEYLFVETMGDRSRGAVGARQRLGVLTSPDRLSGWLHYRVGDPKELLPRVVAERDYDLLLVGLSDQQTAHAGADAMRGPRPNGTSPWIRADVSPQALPVRLLRSAAGDLLLVPALEQATGES